MDLIYAKTVDEQAVAINGVCPYFKVENSEFVKWQMGIGGLVEEDVKELSCYGFTEEGYLIEVLSYTEPKVEIEYSR